MQGRPPTADDSIETIRSFFEQRGAILAGDFLIGLGWALFLWFLGSARSYLHAHEGDDARLASIAFGGGLVGAALVLASTAGLNGIANKRMQPTRDRRRAFSSRRAARG